MITKADKIQAEAITETTKHMQILWIKLSASKMPSVWEEMHWMWQAEPL